MQCEEGYIYICVQSVKEKVYDGCQASIYPFPLYSTFIHLYIHQRKLLPRSLCSLYFILDVVITSSLM